MSKQYKKLRKYVGFLQQMGLLEPVVRYYKHNTRRYIVLDPKCSKGAYVSLKKYAKKRKTFDVLGEQIEEWLRGPGGPASPESQTKQVNKKLAI